MKKSKIGFWFVILTVIFATLACSFSASTAKVTDAVMTSDEQGQNQTSVYGPTDDFYCIVNLANAPDDTKVNAVWTAIDAEGVDANTVILEKELVSGSDTLTFSLTNDNLWPSGKYKVDIQLNGTTVKTVEFQVE
ncbi:MAG: hypothetical protein BGO78_10545 [Chloroflexi bacterium 44-23]|nr:MAG: hypothetical protein BGO78_10545 [Chloroflexi bacterium 44-23]